MNNTDVKCLVLLGLDKDKKPRAARFSYTDELAVRKLASVIGYKIGHAKTDEAVEMALKLVDGKIFHSGRGLLPLVKPETFEKLRQVLEIENVATPPTNKEPASALPDPNPGNNSWANIKVGSVVLCPNDEKGKEQSWWETTVTAISKDGRTLTLRWTHFPTFKPFTFKRKDVALMPNKARG